MYSSFTNLLLCALGVNHIYIDALVHQLVEQLSGSPYGLHKHQHGRHEPLRRRDEMIREGL